MIEYRANLSLHENQMKVHNCPSLYRVIKAGKRFGKTKWALFELFQRAARERNKVFWYIAPTYKQAKQIAWFELKWLIPKELIERRVETDLLIELKSGSTIQLIGADNEDALRGPHLDGVIFDEAAYIKEHVWPAIIRGQLLGAKGQKSGFAFFISSPNKTGRNWFTTFHDDAKKRELSGDPDWAAFYFTIHDNPTLNPEEVQKMKDETPEDTWNLEYLAIESAYAGVLYSEFSSDKNLGEPDWNSTNLHHFRGIDWGIDHPTVCLWATLDYSTKTLYITDEFVRSDLVISESADMIKTRTGTRHIEWTVIDPSTAKRNSQTRRSDALEFNRNGIPTVMADNRFRGVDVMKMFLKKGALKISPKCKTLIYTLKTLQRGEDENDDTTDCARYITLKIHDSIAGMNILEIPSNQLERSHEPGIGREINIYDPVFETPKEEANVQQWLLEEIGAV